MIKKIQGTVFQPCANPSSYVQTCQNKGWVLNLGDLLQYRTFENFLKSGRFGLTYVTATIYSLAKAQNTCWAKTHSFEAILKLVSCILSAM
jgi:hypothetical protein